MDAASRKTDITFRIDGQARQFAEAGLVDALAWFRRQTAQPVMAFDPRRDATATPPILDTDEPAVGIVRQFEIARGVWGRYEVRRFVPNVDPPLAEVLDVSKQRGAPTFGSAWKLVSRGFVFRRVSDSVAFNEQPNQVLGTEVVETEVRRITFAPPAQAALCVGRGGCLIDTRARVRGGVAAGIARDASGPVPVVNGELTGMPLVAALSPYSDSCQAIFGVDRDQLRSLADDRISDNAQFPSPIPNDHIIFVETSLTFDRDRPLRGKAIVYVEGDVTLQAGSNSFFSGLLIVTGRLTIEAPSLLRGAIVARGGVTVRGQADYAEVEFDESILDSLILEIGQYRLSSSVRRSELRESINQ
jgi:hypothetical protein